MNPSFLRHTKILLVNCFPALPEKAPSPSTKSPSEPWRMENVKLGYSIPSMDSKIMYTYIYIYKRYGHIITIKMIIWYVYIHSYVCKYIDIKKSCIFTCIYADMAYWEVNIGYLECKRYTQMHLQFPRAKNVQFNRINRIILNQITIKGKFLKFTICVISVLFPEYQLWHMEMSQNS